jgi:hypothetical protein
MIYLFIMLNFSSIVRAICLVLPAGVLIAGCAVPPDASTSLVTPIVTPARDALHTPEQLRSGRLAYAPDRSTFAPVLTERFAYPTQPQAQNAFLRSQWPQVQFQKAVQGPDLTTTFPGSTYPVASVRLFACRPGALDGQTGRIVRYRGPVVVCATEFHDEAGTRLWRVPINFYYHQKMWRMQDPAPPTAPVPWLNREPSPARSWNPFGDRT